MKNLKEYIIQESNSSDEDEKIINNGDGIYLIPINGAGMASLDMCIIKDNKCLKLTSKDLNEIDLSHHNEKIFSKSLVNITYSIGFQEDAYYGFIGPNKAQRYISKKYGISDMYFVCDDHFDKSFAERIQKDCGFTCTGII